ncbi:DUF2972 domain-containing protein [Campylobacter upsaliensis]|uniref:DUF2972 domain-containing protein n=1 Tax=Campylobacter upsaliensis TaxID=28080 RepID=UPI0022EB2E12|nr:DUF2972 domain-containing protein [Campylobacter upsaliensis]MEB2806953.1 DUF2972 domain-containing protein [Campylobacter upsaliensis]MEB2819460.1 DUF2972 domain-containing protein [Campylobacter upsaliensis]
MTIILPLIVEVDFDIKILITNINSSKELPTLKQKYILNGQLSEIFDENLLVILEKEHYEKLINRVDYRDILNYLDKLLKTIQQVVRQEIEKEVSVWDVLNYFKENMAEREDFYKILDKELAIIKTHRPDIVASWKYYEEFEKICEL